jgi:hypothetical protein
METHKRFLTKVLINNKTKCWEWTASLNSKGYGQFYFNGKTSGRAHRYSYTHYKGQIPPDKVVDHLCNNKKCVNPKHLALASNKENVLKGTGVTALNAKKTHCLRGHALIGENLRFIKNHDGHTERRCVTCAKERTRKWAKTNNNFRDYMRRRRELIKQSYQPKD